MSVIRYGSECESIVRIKKVIVSVQQVCQTFEEQSFTGVTSVSSLREGLLLYLNGASN